MFRFSKHSPQQPRLVWSDSPLSLLLHVVVDNR
jgi:hypothetical protein